MGSTTILSFTPSESELELEMVRIVRTTSTASTRHASIKGLLTSVLAGRISRRRRTDIRFSRGRTTSSISRKIASLPFLQASWNRCSRDHRCQSFCFCTLMRNFTTLVHSVNFILKPLHLVLDFHSERALRKSL